MKIRVEIRKYSQLLKQNFKKLTKIFFVHSRNSQNFFFATKKIHLQFQHNYFF